MKKYIVLILIMYLLSGCSLFTVSKPDRRITLSPVTTLEKNTAQNTPITTSISLAYTTSNPILTTNSIVLVNNNSISRVEGAVWAENVTTLLNYIILSSLRGASNFTSISDDTEGIIAEYTIQTSITQWNIEQRKDKEFVAVGEVYCNIVNKKAGIILGQKSWKLEKKLDTITIKSLTTTFQNITNEIVSQLILWTEEEIRTANAEKESPTTS